MNNGNNNNQNKQTLFFISFVVRPERFSYTYNLQTNLNGSKHIVLVG